MINIQLYHINITVIIYMHNKYINYIYISFIFLYKDVEAMNTIIYK